MTLDIHNWLSSAHQEIHKLVKDEIFPIVNQVDARVQNFEIQFLKEAAKFVRDFKYLAKEVDESLAKHKAMELKIEHLLRAVVSQDIMSIVQNNSVVDSSNLQTKLEWKPPSSSKPKLYAVTPLPKSKAIPKIDESHALMNPFKASRVDNFVPNKHVKASVRIKPITVSQPHVITKNDVNSKTHGFSPKYIKSTNKTRRPQPRNNPKSDKVPFKSKSSCLSNNLENIEENHWNLQSSSNKKHMLSACNNIKLAIRNAEFKVVCAISKQCLIAVNHDFCVLNYVNGMNSRGKKQKENVPNQKKHKVQVSKSKNAGSRERLTLPKPSTHISCLRWSPTGRLFDLKGKIIETSESECQSDCFKGDNACTSNPQEPISKRFPNSTFFMICGQNWFDTLLILLLSEYKPMDKDHGDNECDTL
nr:hypothetical protein [Tanacetum cinerariifolium]